MPLHGDIPRDHEPPAIFHFVALARSQAAGALPDQYEAYPGPGFSLELGQDNFVELTPERWAKMVRFVREFGAAARKNGGMFSIEPRHELRG